MPEGIVVYAVLPLGLGMGLGLPLLVTAALRHPVEKREGRKRGGWRVSLTGSGVDTTYVVFYRQNALRDTRLT